MKGGRGRDPNYIGTITTLSPRKMLLAAHINYMSL